MLRPLSLAIAVALACPSAASAQQSSLFNQGSGARTGSTMQQGASSSGNRNSGLTGSAFGNSSSASSSSSSSSRSSGSNGSSLFNSGAGGQSGAGGLNSGTGGQQAFQFGELSQTIGTGAFVGRSDNAGRFVGDDRAGAQAAMGAMQALQGLQGMQRGGGGFNNSRGGAQSDRERLPMRPTQRIAFEFTPATPAVATQRVSSRFENFADRRPALRGVTFATDEAGRVVLRGTVATREASQLAAALVRLEPGVRDVVNELTVENGTAP